MMRRFVGSVLFVVLLFFPVSGAFAQELAYMRTPHRASIFVDGGIGIPMAPGELQKYWHATLPFTVGAGVSIFSWLEINGGLTVTKYGNNSLKSKAATGYVGVQDVVGGSISTRIVWGSAKFIGVPSQRANPILEIGFGGFRTSAQDLEVEEVYTNSMKSVSGASFIAAAGLQYALNASWAAYTTFRYTNNLNGAFAPGNLVRPQGQPEIESQGNMVFSTLVVGMAARF